MAGKKPENCDKALAAKLEETFVSNVTYAADRLQKVSVVMTMLWNMNS